VLGWAKQLAERGLLWLVADRLASLVGESVLCSARILLAEYHCRLVRQPCWRSLCKAPLYRFASVQAGAFVCVIVVFPYSLTGYCSLCWVLRITLCASPGCSPSLRRRHCECICLKQTVYTVYVFQNTAIRLGRHSLQVSSFWIQFFFTWWLGLSFTDRKSSA
jgi:hypothetical protein